MIKIVDHKEEGLHIDPVSSKTKQLSTWGLSDMSYLALAKCIDT